MGTVLIIVILVLLILDIAIAVIVIRLLKSFRRLANLVDSIVDDAEKVTKVLRSIRISSSLTGVLKKIVRFLPGGSDDSKGKK